eukprot:TRINITY_DN12353_c0_g1_i1.p1 TRINITY_DN12353_c0_g1~~TRINITY_DN12353_c0_g1_i1.p1  ORF type:complete len:104 (-),score=16.30 TRINITY_DN12353_c0_g1_i1:181-492(-)
MAKKHDLTLILRTSDEDLHRRVLKVLTDTGIISSGLKSHHVLLCTTSIGKGAMVRQLVPHLYIDDDVDVIKNLLPHLPEIVQILKWTKVDVSHEGRAPAVLME